VAVAEFVGAAEVSADQVWRLLEGTDEFGCAHADHRAGDGKATENRHESSTAER
jgi:hypothetical protein